MSQNDAMLACLIGALLLFGLAVGALAWSSRLRALHGLPGGKVVYSDTGASEIPARSLFSPRYGLTGKPDYLVATRRGLVPVEVKPTREDAEPQESHLLQLLAYCLLLEETEGKRPPYGLLRYKHETFKVDYNSETRAYLINVLDEMRDARQQVEVHRNHEQRGRCRACAYAELCDEALWSAARIT
jgi:CRISPR-associated exonuclease Cas4